MKISFDLDDMLINGIKRFEVEKVNFPQALFATEKLRVGTINLFKELRSQGHQIYIYTTSLRSPYKIWLTFKSHGLFVDGIINKTVHDKQMKPLDLSISKYPPMFGIDLHIDDSEGVGIEAQKYNFKVLIIGEKDLRWTETILAGIKRLK
jgi:hypothetical protein